MAIGIDYGLGRTNIDTATRIRYGVISQHSLASWFYDSWEGEYGDPTCPKCTQAVSEYDDEKHGEYDAYSSISCSEYACDACEITLSNEECYPEEPIGYRLNEDGYQAEDCLDSDVILTKSPFYTYAPFCSPCVPGAGNLDSAEDVDEGSGVKTYCFGHDWFEEHKAPYRVWRVDDDTEVMPEANSR